MQGQLHQLIEFTLLNLSSQHQEGRSNMPPKHLLQERLATLTNPQVKGKNVVQNLGVLDSYLNASNARDLIKDAVRLAKPYFMLNILPARLQEESRKVFDAFKAEKTSNSVLEYYMLHVRHPELHQQTESNPLWLLHSFNLKREKQR